MSIVIEQTHSEMEASHVFNRNADILGVRIASASFSMAKIIPTEVEESLSVGVRYAIQDASLEKGCVHATALFECIITESNDSPAEAIAKFECRLTATYAIQDGYVPSQSELSAFHKANVIFNCWPYFREFVQSSAARMNVPPPPIPFLRVFIKPSKEANLHKPARKTAKKKLKA